MWTLYLTAKTTSSRPSDLVGIADRWAALQFDGAVTLVGSVLENAAQETHNVGSKNEPKWEPRYTMQQLLDDKFRLPAPPSAQDKARAALSTLRAIGGLGGRGVKVLGGP